MRERGREREIERLRERTDETSIRGSAHIVHIATRGLEEKGGNSLKEREGEGSGTFWKTVVADFEREEKRKGISVQFHKRSNIIQRLHNTETNNFSEFLCFSF